MGQTHSRIYTFCDQERRTPPTKEFDGLAAASVRGHKTNDHSGAHSNATKDAATYSCSGAGNNAPDMSPAEGSSSSPSAEDDARLAFFHKHARSRRRAGVVVQSASYENGDHACPNRCVTRASPQLLTRCVSFIGAYTAVMCTHRGLVDVMSSKSELREDATVLSASEFEWWLRRGGGKCRSVPNVAQDCEEAQAIHQAIEWVWEDTLHQAPLRSVLDIALPEASNIVCDTVGAIEWACPVGGAENEPSRMRVRHQEKVLKNSVISFLTQANTSSRPCEIS